MAERVQVGQRAGVVSNPLLLLDPRRALAEIQQAEGEDVLEPPQPPSTRSGGAAARSFS